MKKVFALVLTLALALSMAVMASADTATDIKDFFNELAGTVGVDKLQEAWDSVWGDISKTIGIDTKKVPDAADLPAGTDKDVANGLIEKLGLEGTDMAKKMEDCMSNDFISFLCGMYTGVAPVTGDSSSSVIAIASFAALSAVAAAAFVCMKKKDA